MIRVLCFHSLLMTKVNYVRTRVLKFYANCVLNVQIGDFHASQHAHNFHAIYKQVCLTRAYFIVNVQVKPVIFLWSAC